MKSKLYWIEPLERTETRDEIRITINHRGIGDLVTCAYSVAGIKARTSKRVVWSVLPERKAWAELFRDADEVVTHTRPDNRVIDRFDKSIHRFQGKYSINAEYTRHHQYAKKLGTIPQPPRFDAPALFDWSAHGLSVPPVLIVPESTQKQRMWNRLPADTDSNWIELAARLEREGVPVMALCSREFGRSIKAESPAQMLSILNSVPVVVSVDTGPAHLAAMLGKYTLVLNGIENGAGVFGFYERARSIQGRRVAGKHCSPCIRQAEFGYSSICNEWCEALSLITAEDVFQEVVSILVGTQC